MRSIFSQYQQTRVNNVNIRAGARTFFSEGNALLQLSDQPAESYNLPRVGWSLSMEAGKSTPLL